jgi:hypothetical protein
VGEELEVCFVAFKALAFYPGLYLFGEVFYFREINEVHLLVAEADNGRVVMEVLAPFVKEYGDDGLGVRVVLQGSDISKAPFVYRECYTQSSATSF